jgi:hypothetical protein
MKGDSKEDIFADGYIACRAIVLSRGSFINELGSPHGKQDLSVMTPSEENKMEAILISLLRETSPGKCLDS